MNSIGANPARPSKWLFVLLILLLSLFYDFPSILVHRPYSIHQWRQTDCLSIAKNYYEEGMHFFRPEVHWNSSKGNGKMTGEFPLLNYTAAILWKLFGNHEFLYRIQNLLIFFCGLFLLFRLTSGLLKDDGWGLLLPLFLFTSPLLAFYGNNFLSDVPAFGFVLMGWYFFYRFFKEGRDKHLYLTMLCFLLAGLLKLSSAMSFAFLAFIFFLERLKVTGFGKEGRLFSRPARQAVPFMLVVVLLLCWYFWANHYSNANNKGIFLLGAKPLWEMDAASFREVTKTLTKEWLPVFFAVPVLIATMILFIFNLLQYKKIHKLVYYAQGFLFAEALAFFLLFYQVFNYHDYYLINLMIFVVATFLTTLHYLERNHPSLLHSKSLKIAFSAVLVLSAWYCAGKTRVRYDAEDFVVKTCPFLKKTEVGFWKWFHWDYGEKLKAYETAEPYLRSLGLRRTDRVISIPDQSLNISLYLIDQKGYSGYGFYEVKDEDRIRNFIRLGAKFLIINDKKTEEDPNIKPYLAKKLGTYRNLDLYDLRVFRPGSSEASPEKTTR